MSRGVGRAIGGLELAGLPDGIQRVTVTLRLDEVLGRDVEQALRAEGFTLTPLKCDRRGEGASYGNVVYVLKFPGKQAQGLWVSWNCAHDGCSGSFAILYRRSDVDRVECAGA